ncbi:MAG: histidine kinase [Bacteroidetes bacterium]|nr:histidine kinase [Bacteroidota bacterium]MBU1117049.1 histidine kinase [Bacteroidota bacterium]MBU1797644.1 histidine kinase [Bacteroidota bacterium]
MNLLKKIHFDLYHITILLITIILSQVILSYINVKSIEEVTQESIRLYKWQSAERIADLTTATLELIVQPIYSSSINEELKATIIESIDYTLTQEIMQKNIDDISLLVVDESNRVIFLEDGEEIINFLLNGNYTYKGEESNKEIAKELFKDSYYNLFKNESISTLKKDNISFHILVPFSKHGEIIGAVYMKITPNFDNIIHAIIGSYNISGSLVSALILLTLLGMFFITSFLVKERDNAQKLLFLNKEIQIRAEIARQKESFFTKRIYHAHHKAEKIVGFIKQDLYSLNNLNMEIIRNRMVKYSSFIGRVIYDMKTYNPPINVIRNQSFNSNLNEIIVFIVDNIFKRVFKEGTQYNFKLDLDHKVPILRVNEYVIWQMIEPLIQNCIDHNKKKKIDIIIKTEYDEKINRTFLYIYDTGEGVKEELLEYDNSGIKRIFSEGTSSKDSSTNSGYGCFIAYESSRLCGWKIDLINTYPGTKTTVEIVNE